MSRLASTLKNGWIGLLLHLLYVLSQFFVRSLFLKTLGNDFMGSAETIKNVIKFLNLAELGIGSAVGFSLYNPIQKGDRLKIEEILIYLNYLYKKIAYFLLITGVIITPFISIYLAKPGVDNFQVSLLFFILIFGNFINYYYAYPSILLEADQKNYIVNIYNQLGFVIRLLLQSIILLYFQSVIGWIVLELLTPVFYSFYLRKSVKKIYPWLNLNQKISSSTIKINNSILTLVKRISIHKLGNFITNGTDYILVFSFVNPKSVVFLANYQLIINNLFTLLNKMFVGINASVGNLVAENDKKKLLDIFFQLAALRWFIAAICSYAIYIGLDSFIELWLGQEYVLDSKITICLTLIFYIMQIRQPIDTFVQAHGLYSDTWSPMVQGLINLTISLFGVIQFGILGVLLGTLVSQFLYNICWKPYFLFHNGLKIKTKFYYKALLFHLLLFSIAIIISDLINTANIFEEVFRGWLIIFVPIVKIIIFSSVYLILSLVFDKSFKIVFKIVKTFIKKTLTTYAKKNAE